MLNNHTSKPENTLQLMSQKYLNNFIEHRLQTVILARDYSVNAYSNLENKEEHIFLPHFKSCIKYEYYSNQINYLNVFISKNIGVLRLMTLCNGMPLMFFKLLLFYRTLQLGL